MVVVGGMGGWEEGGEGSRAQRKLQLSVEGEEIFFMSTVHEGELQAVGTARGNA